MGEQADPHTWGPIVVSPEVFARLMAWADEADDPAEIARLREHFGLPR